MQYRRQIWFRMGSSAGEMSPYSSQIGAAYGTSPFVTLPADRTVTIAEKRALMAVITEAEVVLAIRARSRHKAPGTDGLGNDFYKDLQSLLVRLSKGHNHPSHSWKR